MYDVVLWLVVLMVASFLIAQQFKPPVLPLQSPTVAGKVRYVVDGDSLYIRGHKPQIRLWGVDAPEANERGFNVATEQLKRLADGQKITCKIIDQDRYGRTVGRCFLKDGQEINAAMIKSGTASEYKRYSKGFYSK